MTSEDDLRRCTRYFQSANGRYLVVFIPGETAKDQAGSEAPYAPECDYVCAECRNTFPADDYTLHTRERCLARV